MTYDQKKVDELVSNAKVLESLRERINSRMNSLVVGPSYRERYTYDGGRKETYWNVIQEIDRRTVTLMERIYAELVYDEVPFEED